MHRYMTNTPVVAIFLLLILAFPNNMPMSPIYNIGALTSANCKTYWWSALLHIQNYVNPNNLVSYSKLLSQKN